MSYFAILRINMSKYGKLYFKSTHFKYEAIIVLEINDRIQKDNKTFPLASEPLHLIWKLALYWTVYSCDDFRPKELMQSKEILVVTFMKQSFSSASVATINVHTAQLLQISMSFFLALVETSLILTITHLVSHKIPLSGLHDVLHDALSALPN